MYEVVKRDVPFVLAGSIRDDGPLLDTITDTVAAQKAYVPRARGRRRVPDARHRAALDRGRQPAAGPRADGLRRHDRVGSGQALEPRDDAGDRARRPTSGSSWSGWRRSSSVPRPGGERGGWWQGGLPLVLAAAVALHLPTLGGYFLGDDFAFDRLCRDDAGEVRFGESSSPTGRRASGAGPGASSSRSSPAATGFDFPPVGCECQARLPPHEPRVARAVALGDAPLVRARARRIGARGGSSPRSRRRCRRARRRSPAPSTGSPPLRSRRGGHRLLVAAPAPPLRRAAAPRPPSSVRLAFAVGSSRRRTSVVVTLLLRRSSRPRPRADGYP